MSDDDLRFGDVDGDSSTSSGSNDIPDLFRKIITILIGTYVVIKIIEIVFNIPIPVV
jgi:hypothetical protein